VPEQADCKRGR